MSQKNDPSGNWIIKGPRQRDVELVEVLLTPQPNENPLSIHRQAVRKKGSI